jgi:hypothetical protein
MEIGTNQVLICATAQSPGIARWTTGILSMLIKFAAVAPGRTQPNQKNWSDAKSEDCHPQIQKITKRTHFKNRPPTVHQPLAQISSQTSQKNEPIFIHPRTVARIRSFR